MSYLTEFLPSIVGGLLIGLAVVLLMTTTGRIAGISGIVARALPPMVEKSQFPTGAAFLIGILVAGPLFQLYTGKAVAMEINPSFWVLAIAGLLVGIGTKLGSGCTSGHGVCGISRLSLRSVVATVTFIATAAITVFFIRHVIG